MQKWSEKVNNFGEIYSNDEYFIKINNNNHKKEPIYFH